MYVASDVDLISWIVKNQRWLMNGGRSNRLDVKNILSELTTQVHSNMFKIDHTLYPEYVVHIQILSKLLHLSDFFRRGGVGPVGPVGLVGPVGPVGQYNKYQKILRGANIQAKNTRYLAFM